MRKVQLIGMATSSRHLADWDNPDIERWILNESMARRNKLPDGSGPYIPDGGWDRAFQMHPKWDFCVAPNTLVLTKDMRWVRADALSVGDEIVGADEESPRRKLRNAVVESNDVVFLPSYRITLADGTELVASAGHRWLARRNNRTQEWVRTDELQTVGEVRPPNRKGSSNRGGRYWTSHHSLVRISKTWGFDSSWESGYISGVFDGEGCLSGHDLSFAQRDNPCATKSVKILTQMGYNLKEHKGSNSSARQWRIRGGLSEVLRFLGTVRPLRLLENFDVGGRELRGARDGSEDVVSVEFLGEVELQALGTSTGTFIAEGLVSHNSRPNNFNWMNYSLWIQNKSGQCQQCQGKGCEDCNDGLFKPYNRYIEKPIYTLEHEPDIEGSVVYPFLEIMDHFGNNAEHVRYFTNSFGYMVALAIYEGFEEIDVLGFEMASETEYASQKANAEFWIGIAIGKGIKLNMPLGCKLLGQSEELYGYSKIPGITLMHLEIRRNDYQKRSEMAKMEIAKNKGEQEALLKQMNVEHPNQGRQRKMQVQMSELIVAETNLLIQLNAISGALQECQHSIQDLKGLPRPEEIQLIMPQRSIQVVEEV